MRQREVVVEFRTPQHPSLGTNNWGGASPLLARNIPEESLEVRYLKLNSIRTRDEVFAIPDDGHSGYFNHVNAKNVPLHLAGTETRDLCGSCFSKGRRRLMSLVPIREENHGYPDGTLRIGGLKGGVNSAPPVQDSNLEDDPLM